MVAQTEAPTHTRMPLVALHTRQSPQHSMNPWKPNDNAKVHLLTLAE